MLEVQTKTSRHTYHDLENRKEEEVMTLTEKQKQIARKLVTSFGAVSDCEMSLADIHWLTRNIEHALREAPELAEKGDAETLRKADALDKIVKEWNNSPKPCRSEARRLIPEVLEAIESAQKG